MSTMIGKNLKISIFGESHGAAIGVVIDGLPSGEILDFDKILKFMSRRAPGFSPNSTARCERDFPNIISGINGDKTCGTPLCAIIQNTNAKKSDYDKLRDIPRPSHADFTAFMKYGEAREMSGGGHFSGRLTAPFCFVGAVCAQILERRNVFCGAHIKSIKNIADISFDAVNLDKNTLLLPSSKAFPVLDDFQGEKMQSLIAEVKSAKNSVGGIIECGAIGVPCGLGEPMFDGIENLISRAVFAIPAVRGIEFGAGFSACEMLGNEHNDDFILAENGKIRTETNNHGGILGGITSGMPIILRAAIKPTPSIGLAQKSVNLQTKKPEILEISGRHDPCIVPRAVPCVESAVNFVLADLIL